MKKTLLFIVLIGLGTAQFGKLSIAAPPLTKVRIDFIEALSGKDTTSSERYRAEFESAARTAAHVASGPVRKCGYEIALNVSLSSASDPLSAKEMAENAERSGFWMMFGPRRSDHFILTAKGASKTPAISALASARAIEDLPSHQRSLNPNNSLLAKALARAAHTEHPNTQSTYLTITASNCLACTDFSAKFDAAARLAGLRKLGELTVAGESPDLKAIIPAIEKQNPTFVLVPNYSLAAATIIGQITQALPSAPIFLGWDGWGDQNFGFVSGSPKLSKAKGILVRGYLPAPVALRQFAFGRLATKLASKGNAPPASSQGVCHLFGMEKVTKLLCEKRPRSREAFKEVLARAPTGLMSLPWKPVLYRLSGNKIVEHQNKR